jgi:segregation and condensation protein B
MPKKAVKVRPAPPSSPPRARPKRASAAPPPAPEPVAPVLPTEPEAPTPPTATPHLRHPQAAALTAPVSPPPKAPIPEPVTAEGAGNPFPPRSEEEPEEEPEDDEGNGEGATAEAHPKRPKGVAPELMLRVESLLFGANRPLTVHDLLQSLGGDVDHVAVQRACRKLSRTYQNRNTSLEVRRAGDGWALQVRHDYLETAHTLSPTDIPTRTLRVLALIAYHQPIRQSLLVRMVGEVGYQEVKGLVELGFVRAIARASTLELSTTSKFAEYFGLESTDHARIREFLEKKLGISFPPPPPDGGEESPDGPRPPGPDPGPSEGGSAPLPAE